MEESIDPAHSIDSYPEVIARGIGESFDAVRPKKVLIIGAGMAGLVAVYELKRAGHDPLIIEGQHRVGGRVHTLRAPFTEGLYGEVGAMRIPRTHDLTLAYINRFGLSTGNFTMDCPQAYYFIGGHRMRISEANANPSLLGFETSEVEQHRTAGALWIEAIRPLVELLRKDGDRAWEEIVAGTINSQRVSS